MVIRLLSHSDLLFKTASLRLDIDLAPQDRFDPLFERLLVELDPAKEIPMVCDRHGRGTEFLRSIDKGLDRNRAVEKGVLGMKMKVNELRGRHIS